MLYSTAQVGIHIAGPNQEGTTGHSAFLDLALRRDILDMLAQLMGENIILWGAQGFIKPAGAPPPSPRASKSPPSGVRILSC